ncbi:transposase family protein [Streptomyces afghaniensis]|uniref:transposase family protein n=1 Tax=Streptomyces afghaniensis TaxID=66865 RepID=UPI0033AF143C
MRVERLQCGGRRIHLATADASARACPACGVFASRVKGSATTRPRDLVYGESGSEFVWHKRRWWCRETACPRRSFTEPIEQIPAGARTTRRLRASSGRRVRDAGSTVIQGGPRFAPPTGVPHSRTRSTALPAWWATSSAIAAGATTRGEEPVGESPSPG